MTTSAGFPAIWVRSTELEMARRSKTAGSAGDKDQVSSFSSSQGNGLGVRSCVDDTKICTMLPGSDGDFCKTASVCRNNNRGLLIALIVPTLGTSLRVKVYDDTSEASSRRSAGKI